MLRNSPGPSFSKVRGVINAPLPRRPFRTLPPSLGPKPQTPASDRCPRSLLAQRLSALGCSSLTDQTGGSQCLVAGAEGIRRLVLVAFGPMTILRSRLWIWTISLSALPVACFALGLMMQPSCEFGSVAIAAQAGPPDEQAAAEVFNLYSKALRQVPGVLLVAISIEPGPNQRILVTVDRVGR